MANKIVIDIEANTAQARSALSGLKGSFTELNSMIGVGKAALQAIAGAYEQTIGAMVNTRVAMSDTAESIGISVEDFSRLTEVADDNRVSQEQLTQALQLAVKNGYQPSIAGLAKLADSLQDMDAVERAQLLSETFGKSWKNVYKILRDGGPALIANTQKVQDGLVVTQKAAEEAVALAESFDNLGDNVMALMNNALEPLVPVLTRGTDAMLKRREAQDRLIASGVKLNSGTIDHLTTLEVERQRQIDAGLATLANAAAHDVGAGRVADMTAALRDGQPDWSEMPGLVGSSAESVKYFADEAARANEKVVLMAEANLKLKDSTDRLKDAQEKWMSGAGGSFADKIKASGIPLENQRLALAAGDLQFGTSELAAFDYNAEQDRMIEKLKKTGDIPQFFGGMAAIKTEYMKQDEEVTKAREEIEAHHLALDLATAHPHTFTINQAGSWVRGGGGPSANDPGEKLPGLAHGGAFTIPRQYGIEGFNMGGMATASAGEKVNITPAGQTFGNVAIYISGAGDPTAVANAVALRLASYGSQYQGG